MGLYDLDWEDLEVALAEAVRHYYHDLLGAPGSDDLQCYEFFTSLSRAYKDLSDDPTYDQELVGLAYLLRWHAARAENAYSVLRALCHEGNLNSPRILDCGCGTGSTLSALIYLKDKRVIEAAEVHMVDCDRRMKDAFAHYLIQQLNQLEEHDAKSLLPEFGFCNQGTLGSCFESSHPESQDVALFNHTFPDLEPSQYFATAQSVIRSLLCLKRGGYAAFVYPYSTKYRKADFIKYLASLLIEYGFREIELTGLPERKKWNRAVPRKNPKAIVGFLEELDSDCRKTAKSLSEADAESNYDKNLFRDPSSTEYRNGSAPWYGRYYDVWVGQKD